jgi:endoglucanase
MKKTLLIFFLLPYLIFPQKSRICINQLGYLEKSVKTAVVISNEKIQPKYFDLCDALTDEVIKRGDKIIPYGAYENFIESYRLDFSDFEEPGAYYIKLGELRSPNFRIANDVYIGTADYLLNYLREQQCGYNPFLKDSCHMHDGFIVYKPSSDSTDINVTGGWHSSSDYEKFVTVNANTVFQLLFAYQQNPGSFKDEYDKNGDVGPNAIPDILDQAKWGLDWLIKMNPSQEVIFNQVADNRQEHGSYLPDKDKTNYGKNRERPVYFCTGTPQGFFQFKNSSSGLASLAGKFASAFALGSKVMGKYFPDFSNQLKKKSFDVYKLGEKYPGVCQIVPGTNPGLYEEENYADDMELAATQLYNVTNDKKYISDAVKYGEQEPVSPWIIEESFKTYQSYPFLNLGHYYLGRDVNQKISQEFINNLRKGIEELFKKGKSNPFLIGIPFVRYSNNLIAAALTQIRLYSQLTGNNEYRELEAAYCDWLFGCNPWGTSMIIGLPGDRDYPENPYSSIQHITKRKIEGGLISGSVYTSIFNEQKNLTLNSTDKFINAQPGNFVYHDDCNDYLTNEPTLDGTANVTYYLSAIQNEGEKYFQPKNYQYKEGAIVRTDRSKRTIHLVFTGSEYGEGGDFIRRILKLNNAKASFFFTGDFYRYPDFAGLVYGLKSDGHYVGAHFDKDIQLISSANSDSVLISKNEFIAGIKANYAEMEKFGIKRKNADLFFPPHELYNKKICNWCKELGLQLISNTAGMWSEADTTLPGMPNYISSDEIYKRIMQFEKNNIDGLNGCILLMHIGTNPERQDKLYRKLIKLITDLKKKGYSFTLIDD